MDELALHTAVRRILKTNLQLQSDESYLFFTDSNSRWEEDQTETLARREYLHTIYELFLSFAKDWPNARHDKYESTQRHSAEPRENIWRLAFGPRIYFWLLEKDYLWRLREGAEISPAEERELHDTLDRFREDIVDCVIAFPWYSSTHTRFRRLLNGQGCRYVSMPMLSQSVMEGPMMADWDDVAARTERVYNVLCQTDSLFLQCPAGTEFNLEIGVPELIHKDSGDFRQPGAYGNLPAGESYLVPKSGSANGRVVFTSAPGKARVDSTCAIVENSKISGFETQTDYARELDRKFNSDFEMRNIAELGIGTNPMARDVSSMIEGEKICGTVHVAIGSDKAIGGSIEASEHLDHIIVGPTLEARMRDGSRCLIVEDGRLLL